MPERALIYILPIFAGGFLHLDASDLLPEAHEKTRWVSVRLTRTALLIFGYVKAHFAGLNPLRGANGPHRRAGFGDGFCPRPAHRLMGGHDTTGVSRQEEPRRRTAVHPAAYRRHDRLCYAHGWRGVKQPMATQAEEQKHQRRFHGAPEMLRSPSRIELLEVERVVALCLEGIAVQIALDVGTGPGIFADGFAAQGLEVAGIDANEAMLDAARRYVPQGWFVLAQAEAIPYPNGAFDLVFLGHILHEADDPLMALQEAWRVARQRVTVLEWPYRQEKQGPPLAHRLAPEKMANLAQATGVQKAEALPLAHMMLYRLSA